MDWIRALLAVWLGIFALSTHAQDQDACGELKTGFGPFDYRTATQRNKDLVEKTHFPVFVEQLQKGASGSIAADIDYTLRAFPNHPRALLAMMRLSIRERIPKPWGANWPVECYFERGIRFTPDDPVVHILYGIYLLKQSQGQTAESELQTARELLQTLGGDANLNYNLGLAYFDLKDYDKALEQAKIAYSLGFPLAGLRDKLKRAGKWQE